MNNLTEQKPQMSHRHGQHNLANEEALYYNCQSTEASQRGTAYEACTQFVRLISLMLTAVYYTQLVTATAQSVPDHSTK